MEKCEHRIVGETNEELICVWCGYKPYGYPLDHGSAGTIVSKDATASAFKGPTHYCEWVTDPAGDDICRICGSSRHPDPVVALLQQIEQNTRPDDSLAVLANTRLKQIERLCWELTEHGYSEAEIQTVMDGEA